MWTGVGQLGAVAGFGIVTGLAVAERGCLAGVHRVLGAIAEGEVVVGPFQIVTNLQPPRVIEQVTGCFAGRVCSD